MRTSTCTTPEAAMTETAREMRTETMEIGCLTVKTTRREGTHVLAQWATMRCRMRRETLWSSIVDSRRKSRGFTTKVCRLHELTYKYVMVQNQNNGDDQKKTIQNKQKKTKI